jgi:16S rRNA G1207 methylase RsmC
MRKLAAPPVVRVATYDIVYGIAAGSPPARLVVDWDLRRLGGIRGESRCAELADLLPEARASLASLYLNLRSFTAKAQWRRDFAAAARLLRADGELVVRIPERKLVRGVRRALAREFAITEHAERCVLRCTAPRAETPLGDWQGEIRHCDPASGRTLVLRTSPGLFAHTAIDAGTRLLLDTLALRHPDLSDCSVLDVGCGYGALGCTAAARGARVTMIDSDCRAVRLARLNLAANDLPGSVVAGDAAAALPAGLFDLALFNPPTHAGSEVLQAMFARAARGAARVLIVIRTHLAYEKWLVPRARLRRLAVGDAHKVIELVSR